jgi:hypothetical protein
MWNDGRPSSLQGLGQDIRPEYMYHNISSGRSIEGEGEVGAGKGKVKEVCKQCGSSAPKAKCVQFVLHLESTLHGSPFIPSHTLQV